jgi:hypothetical protein
VGVYCISTNEWIEVSLSGRLLGRWKAAAPPDVSIIGAALTPTGHVYLSGIRSRQAAASPLTLTAAFRFEKHAGRLLPVDIVRVAAADRAALLLGNDGDRLVWYAKMPPATLLWVREPE